MSFENNDLGLQNAISWMIKIRLIYNIYASTVINIVANWRILLLMKSGNFFRPTWDLVVRRFSLFFARDDWCVMVICTLKTLIKLTENNIYIYYSNELALIKGKAKNKTFFLFSLRIWEGESWGLWGGCLWVGKTCVHLKPQALSCCPLLYQHFASF